MAFSDLRDFMRTVEEADKLQRIDGADWNLEIGALTELLCRGADAPMLVFDNIPGYPSGYRVAANVLSSPRRFAIAAGLSMKARGLDLVNAWREKVKDGFKPLPPMQVESGPVLENVQTGDDVDVLKFPTPKWHEEDGGRYIGTGDMVIVRDPDDGHVNYGTYRVQVHDKSTATIFMDPGRHGDVIRRKYWAQGKSCPVAVVVGQEPMTFVTSIMRVPQGISEYDYAGWLRGEPVQVVRGPVTGIPIPAGAEIVLEGELVPPEVETREEGPFGEWTGYYASGVRSEPSFKIRAILHRNDPIIYGAPPLPKPVDPFVNGMNIMRSAQIWDELNTRVPGVKGVWSVDEAAGPHMVVVSIEQKYGGHAMHTAMAVSSAYTTAQLNRFVVIVDDDIDPSNLSEVLWALGTRCDPETSIEVLRHCYGGPLDSTLPPDKRANRDYTHSKAIILACKPYAWMKEFPIPIGTGSELKKTVKQKWRQFFEG